MSWNFRFNATTHDSALLAWDRKVAELPEYTRKEAAPEFAAMRSCVERLIDLPGGFWSVETYGDHCKDDSKAERPTCLYSIFFEIKRGILE